MQTLTTARLILEPLTASHAAEMFEVLCDPEIYRYLDESPPTSVEQLRERYRRLDARRSPDGDEVWLNWAIRSHGQLLVGFVQATIVAHNHASVAFVIGSKHGGRGYAYEATHAMLEHLTASYGVPLFMATVDADNQRSICLLERLAFRSATPDECARHGFASTEVLFIRDSS